MPSELPKEPGPCQRPVAEHRAARHLEHFGGLIDVEATEEPKLDDLASARIDDLQHLERLVQRFEILILALDRADLGAHRGQRHGHQRR